MSENPLLSPWNTPFGLPPFGAIEPAHFPPAFEAAMAAHRIEIAEIGANPAAPSFANTVEALEGAGRLLSRIGATFFNLVASHATETLPQVERDIAPKLAAHRMAVALDPALFRRVAALHQQREGLALAPDQHRLLERLHLRLMRAGAGLDAKARARLSEISTPLATLHTSFGQNVLADENE